MTVGRISPAIGQWQLSGDSSACCCLSLQPAVPQRAGELLSGSVLFSFVEFSVETFSVLLSDIFSCNILLIVKCIEFFAIC